MPTPAKRPPTPKDSSADTLALFFQNIEEMKRWYRGASYSGHTVGHVVMAEVVLSNISVALEKAMKGEHWGPPDGSSP